MAIQDFKRSPKIDFTRDREITANRDEAVTPRAGPLSSQESKDRAKKLFEDLSKVRDKAKDLEDEIVRVSQAFQIPIPESATEVRVATRRQDPDSRGLFISFDLYLRAIAAKEVEQEALTTEDLPNLTGNLSTDGQFLTQKILKQKAGFSEEEVVLILSQFFHLYILQQMQSGFQAMESGKHTAPKFPEGTEAATVAVSVIQSLVFLLGYSSNHQDIAKRIMEELKHPQVNLPEVFDKAQDPEVVLPPLARMAIKARMPTDMGIILSFAQDFVRNTDEPGYEPWAAAMEVRWVRRDLDRVGQFDQLYANGMPLSSAVEDLYGYRIRAHNDSLNVLGHCLSSQINHNSLPELTEFFSEMTGPTQEAASGLLHVFLGSQGLKSFSSGLTGRMLALGVSLLDELLQRSVAALYGDVRSLLIWLRSPQMMERELSSRALNEFTNFIVGGAEGTEELIHGLVKSLYETLRSGHGRNQQIAHVLVDRRRARVYLSVLEFSKRLRAADGFTGTRLRQHFEAVNQRGVVELPRGDDPLRHFPEKDSFRSDLLEQIQPQDSGGEPCCPPGKRPDITLPPFGS